MPVAGLIGSYNIDFGQAFDTADAAHAVDSDLFLTSDLRCIVDMQPVAPAAPAVEGAGRFPSRRGGFEDFHRTGMYGAAPFSGYFDFDRLARRDIVYKNDAVAGAGKPGAAERELFYEDGMAGHYVQYAFAKITRRCDGSPEMTHVPGSSFASSGMQRMVTPRSFLTCSSTSALPFQ
jgi:hypothetical protein